MTALSVCEKFTKLYTYDLGIFLYAWYIRRKFYFKKKTVIIPDSSFSHISYLDQCFLLALIQNLYKIWPFLTTSQLLILCKPNSIFLNLFPSSILVFLFLPWLPVVYCQYSHHSELVKLNWIVLLPTKSSNWFLISNNCHNLCLWGIWTAICLLPSPTRASDSLYSSLAASLCITEHTKDIPAPWHLHCLDVSSLRFTQLIPSLSSGLRKKSPWSRSLSLQWPPLTDSFLFLFCSSHQICTQCQYEQLLAWCSGQKVNKIGKDYSLREICILAEGDKNSWMRSVRERGRMSSRVLIQTTKRMELYLLR